jgi:hypothetical protein
LLTGIAAAIVAPHSNISLRLIHRDYFTATISLRINHCDQFTAPPGGIFGLFTPDRASFITGDVFVEFYIMAQAAGKG